MKRLYLLLLFFCLLFTGCAEDAGPIETSAEPTVTAAPTTVPTTAPTTAPTTVPTEPPDPIDELLNSMTLREKIGQLFIVQPDALTEDGNAATELTEYMVQMLEQYPIGGIVQFTGNIVSPDQITQFNQALDAVSRIPLFLCVDEEGGSVARLANHPAFDLPRYKNAAAVGKSEDPEDAREMGRTIGAYLAEYGFNVDFAPVADVNTNPNNRAIGKRAFSGSAEVVTQMAAAMAEGLNEQGIIAAFKHFPGHGDTAEDSHNGLAVTYRTGQQLANCEILPFLMAESNDFIMVGHIAVPEETGTMEPTSMSEHMVSTILKGTLGFEGLVITDSLVMEAITDLYTPAEASVTALKAGCDILLIPEDLSESFEAVAAAVEDGTLSQQWLDETVYRILSFKAAHGLLITQ